MAPAIFPVTSLADAGPGTLRQAILVANAQPGDDAITFGVTGTINLASALPDLGTNIDIQGPGANLLTVRHGTWVYPQFFRIFTVDSSATVTLSGLTISNGWQTLGAGISNSGTLSLINATVTGCWNGSNANAGGIYNDGMLSLTGCTISGNNGYYGGGIYNKGTLSLSDSTVSGNTGEGGGIYNVGGTIALANDTITGNTSYFYGGGLESLGGTLHTRDTIVAGNYGLLGVVPSDLECDIGSLGHNLIGYSSGGSGFDPTDRLNVDPLLGPLQNNGGLTFTRALLPGSPALDAGDNTGAPSFDQRGPGFARIVNGRIDIGAYEFQGPVSTASTTTSLISALNPSVYSQAVTFTATVTPSGSGTPTGTVTFKEGAIILGTGTLGSGQAQFTTSSLDAGSRLITAVYNGDTNFSGSTSSALSQTVNPASTTISLASYPNPSFYGWPLALIATVSPVSPSVATPSGTVTFKEGSTILGTVQSDGQFTLITSALAVGSHTITAVYSGSDFSGSTSSALSQTIDPAGTSTTVSSSANPSTVGQSMTFTANVSVSPSVATPTGTVTFKDGATSIGSATVDASGQAQFTTSSLGAGAHSIAAVYSGDTNFISSTSSALGQMVIPALTTSTTTSLTSSANPAVFSQAVTFTATVVAAAPGIDKPAGTVTFRDGVTTIGSAALDASGQAWLTLSSLGAGSHRITATYGGDANFSVSAATLTQMVNPASTTTNLVSSSNPAVFGQPVNFTATVVAVAPGVGTPPGTVTFREGATTIGSAALDASGQAQLTLSSLPPGSHSITAVYRHESDFADSTSTVLSQTVIPAITTTTTTSLTSSAAPSVYGQAVTFTATVAAVSPGAGTPAGTVTFYRDGSAYTGALYDGKATFTTAALAAGTHAITAVYGGGTNFSGSTSAALTQTVNPASTATGLASSANPSVYGQAVTFTATVAGVSPGAGTPIGSVTFAEGTTILGTGTLDASGRATFTTSSLRLGSHSIVAVYDGDANFGVSTATAPTQTVNRANTATGLASSANPSVYRQPVTFTATVAAVSPGAGTPTGKVTFKYGSIILGTRTLDASGRATYTASSLRVGRRSITVLYKGSTNYRTSTSAKLTQTVRRSRKPATQP
jgi:hypothetical protein